MRKNLTAIVAVSGIAGLASAAVPALDASAATVDMHLVASSTPNNSCLGCSAVKAAWSAVPGATGYGMTYSYTNANGDAGEGSGNTPATSIPVGVIPPGEIMTITVTANNQTGDTSTIHYLSPRYVTPTLPGVPTNLSGGGLRRTVADLSWRTPGAKANAWRIQLWHRAGHFIVNDLLVVPKGEEISGLHPGTKYFWHVRARNQAGVTAWSATAHFTTHK